MCLAQGPQGSDAGEAGTCGPLVSSQALYHCAPYPDQDRCYRPFCVGFVALRPKSTAMVMAGRSVHLTTLLPKQA